jgi:hypothetical protein
MYATVRRYEGITDPAEVGRRVSEGFVPLLREIEGLVAYYWIDAGNGLMVSTTVFEDQAGVDASNQKAADWIRDQNLGDLMPNPPEITTGEVLASAAA